EVTAAPSCSIEGSVSPLKQASIRKHAVCADKGVNGGERTRRRNSENSSAPFRVNPAYSDLNVAAVRGCTVKISVSGLNQTSGRISAVLALQLRTKVVNCGQRTRRGDFEKRAEQCAAVGAQGSPIKISIGAQRQGPVRLITIRTIRQ